MSSRFCVFAARCGRKILINEGFEINGIYMIMNAYARLNPDSVEANLLKQVSTNYDDILKIWSEGLVKMSREENFVSIDTSSESIFPLMLSERTWTESEYVTARKKMVEKISNTQKKRMVSLSIAFSLTKTKK